jgi:diaminohydroxyphosphoribosylaminopyrimidine deaminase / 5-amino-6-(5-phosphoribosylamino)uracil reductase
MNPVFMREALDLARKGRGLTSPNPMVGAVLVRDGEVVGRGFHTYAGLQHAEAIALAEAGEKARGATLYLNLEPCSHQGRTPPCVDALIQAGVARVVAPVEDPNPLVAGGGFRKLRAAGVEVEDAAEFAAEAEKLNEPFLYFMRTGRPLVTLKTAITLDGKISAPDDNRGWITSERARAHVQQLRHDHDAILTGVGTVLADDCRLNDRTGLARCRPLLRLVLDSQLRLPLDSKLVRSAAGDVVAVTTSAASAERRKALEARGVPVLVFDGRGGRVDIGSVVAWLGAERYLSLVIEAGSKVNWAALEGGWVDRVFF